MTALPAERLPSDDGIAATACFEDSADPVAPRFETLYAAYRPFLRKVAIGKFRVPPDAADDLVQDVFATYLANSAAVQNPHAYLIGAICNASRKWHRRGYGAPSALDPEDDTCDTKAHHDLVDGVVKNLVIGATLAKLGPKCRDTLRRFHLYGETAVSIARSRGTSANYICRLLSYCRGRAREMYLQMNGGAAS